MGDKTRGLAEVFSEYGLIRRRVAVEVRWLLQLTRAPGIDEVPPLSPAAIAALMAIADDFDLTAAAAVKAIEPTTNHDVKAVEYFIKERIARHAGTGRLSEFIHFACTSEDINNLAYALMLREARERVLLPRIDELMPACARWPTHTPTCRCCRAPTASRPRRRPSARNGQLRRAAAPAREQLARVPILGKMNGAVGNFNAHLAAYPDVDWPALAATSSSAGPRVEPVHDADRAARLHGRAASTRSRAQHRAARSRPRPLGLHLARLLPAERVAGEVGSSTMPHKVNPIDFENAEGNLGLANALLGTSRQTAGLALAARPDRFNRTAQYRRRASAHPIALATLGKGSASSKPTGTHRRRP